MAEIIRKIRPGDSQQIARIIRTVMPQFGAGGKGFAIHDAEVDDMYNAYQGPAAVYYVCDAHGSILGGGGIGPLAGGEQGTCELKKMYFLEAGRGKGLGQKVLDACLADARAMGYDICYLETFNTMTAAMKLYEKNGFRNIPGPRGNTGHFACDTFYELKLGR